MSSPADGIDWVVHLPRHIWEYCVELLPLGDLLCFRAVCKEARQLVDEVCKKRGISAREEETPTFFFPDPVCLPFLIDDVDDDSSPQPGGLVVCCWRDGAPWLHHVVCVGRADAIGWLVRMGADPDVRGGECLAGMTALMLAAAAGDVPCIDALLKAGADVNATDDMERSALTWAGRLGHAGACKRLLGAGADVNHASDMRTTDLMQAARAGLENVVREMASRGAGVDVSEGGTGWLEEGEGRTALMHAALGGQPGCVRALLDAGARASKRSAILATALHFAAKGGSAEAVRMLLLAGCDANQRDAVGLSPLCYAMEGPASCEAVLEELVRGGADLGWVNQDGMTALMVAARVRNAEAVRFLLAKGANCSATDNKGRTALMYAAQWHVSEEVVDVLLEAGVDVDAVDRDGRNAAAYGAPGRLGSMGVFAERGSDVTLVGSDGESALSIAARRGDHESVRAALACGAVGACTKAGERAMRIALEHGCWGVVTALLDYGASAEGARRHLADAAGASDGELDALESVRHTLSRI